MKNKIRNFNINILLICIWNFLQFFSFKKILKSIVILLELLDLFDELIYKIKCVFKLIFVFWIEKMFIYEIFKIIINEIIVCIIVLI